MIPINKWAVLSALSLIVLLLFVYTIPPSHALSYIVFYLLVWLFLFLTIQLAVKNKYLSTVIATGIALFLILKMVELATPVNTVLLIGIIGVFGYFAKQHK